MNVACVLKRNFLIMLNIKKKFPTFFAMEKSILIAEILFRLETIKRVFEIPQAVMRRFNEILIFHERDSS